MHFKDRDAPERVMAITTSISLVVFLTIPVYAAAVELYRRPAGSLPAQIAAYSLVAVLVAGTVFDRWRTRSDQRGRVNPWYSQFLLAVAVAIVFVVNLAAGGAYGTYHILFLLPMVIVAVMGDVTMISVTWVLSLVALGIATYLQSDHAADTMAWTLAINASAWAGAAVAIHLTVRHLISALRVSESVAELATAADRVDRWPEDLAACMPLLATALMARQVTVLAGPAGTPPVPVAAYPDPVPDGGGPDGAGPPGLEDGVRRALDADGPVDVGDATFVPRRTASGVVVVVAAVGRARTVLRASDTSTAITSAQLIAGAVDRVSVIGGLRLEVITDPLTGLANRRGMQHTMERMLGHAARTGEPMSVAMLDLDHFKDYNDLHGHLVGDRALTAFADELSRDIRRQDLAARYGGEEFCLLLPSTDLAGATALVQLIRSRGPGGRHDVPGDRRSPVTAIGAFTATRLTFSAGVAQWNGHESAEELLARADQALYRAKEGGRDAVEVAS
ncbi:MAG: GGDEF domain-containing protein [Actinomycetota bacterium]|nr:GGDEF domain-containing protein [Actinomycetota bacterium]